ncbi:Protein phosphatase 2C family protein [Rhynchospora pubera]|uniref:protein-serine/threonine phosphatase n=1 Tax=Rhynchospora pubera TaxID=906938 RepID=A0AAV8DY49_9POAL|nr:Protein phosphatase 2C family protein [Rhynchospora pubera]KAJ4786859.1 Protein phosphatase 2C family protein [Rhynchospora pubera]
MGGCFSQQDAISGVPSQNGNGKDKIFYGREGGREKENTGVPRVMLGGSCRYASMFTQQGMKGVNQDTMTIWEDSSEEKFQIFCGVFDGHGPYGHKVARYVRDALPTKLCTVIKSTQGSHDSDSVMAKLESSDNSDMKSREKSDPDQFIFSWENNLIKAFEDLDQDLKHQTGIDCICSGTTAVSVVKVREHLIIANLGDSRAVLCTRDGTNQLVPIQLSTDHKPDIQSETERIISCNGRAFALEEEPDIHRLWLPEDDSPGLAMSRAFGDFCLKEFGLIATPEVSHRILSAKDEFLILASDGIWDVLSNEEAVKIVSSTKNRSKAAKKLVKCAAKAWKHNHPASKIDDCAVICIFLKELSSANSSAISHGKSFAKSLSSGIVEEADNNNALNEEYSALEGVSRANSILKLPRVLSSLSRRKRSFKLVEDDD